MDRESFKKLREYTNSLNQMEQSWRDYGLGGGGERMDMTWLAFGVECANRINQARHKLFEIFPELKQSADGNFYGRKVRDFLEQMDFSGLDSTYFTGLAPIYKIHVSAEELFSQGMWTDEKNVCVGVPSFHKYLPGTRVLLSLGNILDDRMATSEEVEAERKREQKRWENMPFKKRKKQLQFNYDMGLDVDPKDIKKYNIKTSG